MMDRKARYMPVWGRYVEMFQSDHLTDAQVGKLLRAMLAYYFDGKEPEELPGRLEGYWYFLGMDLNDAQSSYEQRVQSGQKGGKRSAQVRREEHPEATEAEETEAPVKEIEAPSREVKQKQPITRTESRTESKTESRTEIDTGSAAVSVDKKSYGEFGWIKLTAKEYRMLEASLGKEELGRCIAYIDEAAQSTGNRNRWKDWSLILRRCHQYRWHEPKGRSAPAEIPKGASGHLGTAELEAIQQLMQREIPEVEIHERQDRFQPGRGYTHGV